MSQQDMIQRRVYQEMESILEEEIFTRSSYPALLAMTNAANNTVIPYPPVNLTPNIQANRRALLTRELYSHDGVNIPGIRVTVEIRQSNTNQLLGTLETVVTGY